MAETRPNSANLPGAAKPAGSAPPGSPSPSTPAGHTPPGLPSPPASAGRPTTPSSPSLSAPANPKPPGSPSPSTPANQTSLPAQPAIGRAAALEIDNFEAEVGRFERGELSAERFRAFRLAHGIYGQRQPGVQMVRVKIPTGELDGRQLHRLADIAEEFSATGMAHLTTRQDVQIHYIPLARVPHLMRLLAEVGLTTREACGNSVRNVTACPLTGFIADELFDVQPYALATYAYLVRNPFCQQLARKFKIAFSSCPEDCASTAIHDIGLVGRVLGENGNAQVGFRVLVGGGLGATPFVAEVLEEFVPLGSLLLTIRGILKVFSAHGNRRNKTKARLKFVVHKQGIAVFRRAVTEAVASLTAEERREAELLSSVPEAHVATVAEHLAGRIVRRGGVGVPAAEHDAVGNHAAERHAAWKTDEHHAAGGEVAGGQAAERQAADQGAEHDAAGSQGAEHHVAGSWGAEHHDHAAASQAAEHLAAGRQGQERHAAGGQTAEHHAAERQAAERHTADQPADHHAAGSQPEHLDHAAGSRAEAGGTSPISELVDSFKRLRSGEYAAAGLNKGLCGAVPDVGSAAGAADTAAAATAADAAAGPDTAFQRWQQASVRAHTDPARAVVTVVLPLGDIEPPRLRALARLVTAYAGDRARIAIDQNLVLPDVTRAHVRILYEGLAAQGMAEASAGTALDVTSCPGADTCGIGITSSKGLTRAIREELLPMAEDGLLDLLRGVTIKISGCPNSCGQHHIANIGLHGVVKTIGGRQIPSYQLHLGGRIGAGEARIGTALEKIPARRVPRAVAALLKLFQRERRAEENFADFAARYPRKALESLLKPFADGVPDGADAKAGSDADAGVDAVDWGQDGAFTTEEIGVGECAGAGTDVAVAPFDNYEAEILQAALFMERGQWVDAVANLNRSQYTLARILLERLGKHPGSDYETTCELRAQVIDRGSASELWNEMQRDIAQLLRTRAPSPAAVVVLHEKTRRLLEEARRTLAVLDQRKAAGPVEMAG